MDPLQQLNHERLLAEIALIRQLLLAHLQSQQTRQGGAAGRPLRVLRRAEGDRLATTGDSRGGKTAKEQGQTATTEQADSQPQRSNTAVTLDNLCNTLSLSLFERQLLVLCAGMELDPELPTLCTGISPQGRPNLALALALFDDYWLALLPEAPLRYYHLIEQQQDHPNFAQKSLTISPWALLYLTCGLSREPLMEACLTPLQVQQPVLAGHQRSADRLYRVWQGDNDTAVIAQLIVASGDDHRQVAALAAARVERPLYELNLYNLSLQHTELQLYRRLLQREVLIQQCLLLIDCQRLQADGESESDLYPLRHLLDGLFHALPGAGVLSAHQPVELPNIRVQYLRLPPLTQAEQVQLWQHCLAVSDNEQDSGQQNHSPPLESALDTTLQRLSAQFNLSGQQLRSIAGIARQTAAGDPAALRQNLWQYSREQCRRHLQNLAQVIPPGALGWDNLILPDAETVVLQEIVAQVNRRQQVYQQWGFARQVPYGLGISVLFSGSSGTGKTLAARIIASQLQLDLYHIDLSSVVDKYIGETEKNLDKIFQVAENSGAILLFDEADALFGKRSKVQDARDRYANMGISFLLQRMENYSGLSILTTNLRSAMDDAFMRRLRFIVPFPFPNETERQKIWRCMFPDSAPMGDIDYKKLSRLTLAGGSIRNIALQAAFRSADQEQAIGMVHLLHAVRQEYNKAEKTLDERLVEDW